MSPEKPFLCWSGTMLCLSCLEDALIDFIATSSLGIIEFSLAVILASYSLNSTVVNTLSTRYANCYYYFHLVHAHPLENHYFELGYLFMWSNISSKTNIYIFSVVFLNVLPIMDCVVLVQLALKSVTLLSLLLSRNYSEVNRWIIQKFWFSFYKRTKNTSD